MKIFGGFVKWVRPKWVGDEKVEWCYVSCDQIYSRIIMSLGSDRKNETGSDSSKGMLGVFTGDEELEELYCCLQRALLGAFTACPTGRKTLVRRRIHWGWVFKSHSAWERFWGPPAGAAWVSQYRERAGVILLSLLSLIPPAVLNQSQVSGK